MPLALWFNADGTERFKSKRMKAPKRAEYPLHWYREAVRALQPKEKTPELSWPYREHILDVDVIHFRLPDNSVVTVNRKIPYIG